MVWRFDNGSFSLNTTEAIKAGDEIYNNYAPKSNGECECTTSFLWNPQACFAETLVHRRAQRS